MKSITQRDLIRYVRDRCPPNMRTPQVALIVDLLVEEIGAQLALGNQINLPGFGIFKVRDLPERDGRNPHTNLPMRVRPMRQAKWRPALALKKALAAGIAKKHKTLPGDTHGS